MPLLNSGEEQKEPSVVYPVLEGQGLAVLMVLPLKKQYTLLSRCLLRHAEDLTLKFGPKYYSCKKVISFPCGPFKEVNSELLNYPYRVPSN